MKADKLLLGFRRRPDDDEDAFCLGFRPGLEMHAVRPDADIPASREVAAPPALAIPLPLGREP